MTIRLIQTKRRRRVITLTHFMNDLKEKDNLMQIFYRDLVHYLFTISLGGTNRPISNQHFNLRTHDYGLKMILKRGIESFTGYYICSGRIVNAELKSFIE